MLRLSKDPPLGLIFSDGCVIDVDLSNASLNSEILEKEDLGGGTGESGMSTQLNEQGFGP